MWWSTPAGRTFCLHRMSASEPVRGRIRSRTTRTVRYRRRRCRPNLNCEHIHGLVRMVWGSWICVDETKERERGKRARGEGGQVGEGGLLQMYAKSECHESISFLSATIFCDADYLATT